MRTYAIAVYYRYDGGYLARYDQLLQMLSGYPEIWMEAPSLFILKTDEEIGAVEGKIYSAGFRPETDILMVIDVTDREAAYAGKVEHSDRLQTMLPAREKAPPGSEGRPTAISALENWRALAGGKPMQAGFLATQQPQFGFKGIRRPKEV